MRRELRLKQGPFSQVQCQSIGSEFLETALTFSTLLAPGSVEVDSAYAREPEVKSPSSNQCKNLHLLHYVL